ncbi:hypothetical protein [Gilvibacter sp.]|uniref:hypothetical protein n=1 Tax=Gilvibacter sp. TaxID=2729997 RepID=UPI003F4A80A9
MKKYTLLLFLFAFGFISQAQDALTTELFDIDNIMKYKTEISLTDKQMEAIKAHYYEGNKKFTDAKWKLAEQKAKLDELLRNPEVAIEETMAQMYQVTIAESEVKLARLFTLLNIKNELKADQQVILKEMISDTDRKPFFITTDINNEKKVKFQISGSQSTGPTPLYIIKSKFGDYEINTDQLKTKIDPNNIESISVIKGQSAIAIYGSRGENGVIEITLKKEN